MTKSFVQVHKFGGSSLANSQMFQTVGEIIDAEQSPSVITVSAMGGITDQLLELVDLASQRDSSYRNRLDNLRDRQLSVLADLFSGDQKQLLRSQISDDFRDIEEVLRALWLMHTSSEQASSLISGYGEIWSAQILAAHLSNRGERTEWLNARDVLTVTHGELGPAVKWDQTKAALDRWLETRSLDHLVVTGFIASAPDNSPTTLGRNGSDFTASIFASLLATDRLDIWTDVDGVMSANPGQVPDARILSELSYHEAMELAYFGASILHPRTMSPVVESGIPIRIRNTNNPDFDGSRILPETESDSPVKGFATIEDMALVNLEGSGMVGVPGIANRLFDALQQAEVSVVMISQASSEHSICFAVPSGDADLAKKAVENAFFSEKNQGLIQNISVDRECSILAAVGDKMAGTPGIAGTLFDALAKAGVNIKAIAQGSSERNISAVISEEDETQALRAAHSGFYLSNQTLSIGLIGPGDVGSKLIEQLDDQLDRLRDEEMVDLRLRGLMNSSKMALAEDRIELTDWRAALDAGQDSNLDAFVDHIQSDYHPHAVVIDCTANQNIAERYGDWLDRGIHVVTPNKKAHSGNLDYYKKLKNLVQSKQSEFLFETTVCAGLPVLQTLENLVETGDEILSVEGVFSGTLSYLFNSFEEDRPFSEVLLDAYEKGYTEPDPREDLSGMDVARKVVILGREMGLDLSLDDVDIEPLVPDSLQDVDKDEFFERLPEFDDEFDELLTAAKREGNVLRFVGRVSHEGDASAKLQAYDEAHPFARIDRTDNIVQFVTRRYKENPLVVQGPGAGTDVTAAGIFADILRLTQTVSQPE